MDCNKMAFECIFSSFMSVLLTCAILEIIVKNNSFKEYSLLLKRTTGINIKKYKVHTISLITSAILKSSTLDSNDNNIYIHFQ